MKRHSFNQVLSIARILYHLEPFPWEDFERFNLLIGRAHTWLDVARYFHERHAKARSTRDDSWQRAMKRYARIDKLPDPVPFEKAACVCMNIAHIKRAVPRFEALVRSSVHHLPGESLENWKKNGVPKDVMSNLLAVREFEEHKKQERRKTKLAKKRGGKLPINKNAPEDRAIARHVAARWLKEQGS
jgi:hypothetical protein